MKKQPKLVSDVNLLNSGLTGGICLAISLYVGYKADIYFSCRPWGIIAGIVIGLGACMLEFWEQISKQLKELDDDDRDKTGNKQA